MSTYLIDFENVKSGGLTGIEHIRKEDSVHLFWSKRENKISIEMMELIRRSESEIVMHQAVTGERDALDHQLCSYLGFLAGSRGENDFVIISNDKAYDHLIEFWKKLDDGIRIRRVAEISKISEQVREQIKVQEAAAAKNLSEKNTDKTEQGSVEQETVFFENRNGRNARRRDRDRGGKYLRGGRNGKNGWKNTYQEEEPEEISVAAEPVEAVHVENTEDVKGVFEGNSFVEVKEEAGENAEETVAVKETKQLVVSDAAEEVEEVPEVMKEKDSDLLPAAPKKISPALVVTGIRTGILVESGFTADGILENRKPVQETSTEKTMEAESVETAEKKESAMSAADDVEETVVIKAEMEPAKETAETKVKTEPMKKTAGMKAESELIEEIVEVKAESEPAEEIVEAKTESELVKEVVEAKVETEPVNEAVPDNAAEETIKEAEQKVAKSTPEKNSEKKRNNRKTDNTAEEKTEKSPRKKPARKKTEKNPKTKAAALSDGEKPVEKDIEKEAEKAVENTSEKMENKNRARRGRPPKKNHAEISQEAKAPATTVDVIAKYEDAANEKWAGEVAELINQSRDKKELYAAIVKLLGQEKGRTVYHAIKVLK